MANLCGGVLLHNQLKLAGAGEQVVNACLASVRLDLQCCQPDGFLGLQDIQPFQVVPLNLHSSVQQQVTFGRSLP